MPKSYHRLIVRQDLDWPSIWPLWPQVWPRNDGSIRALRWSQINNWNLAISDVHLMQASRAQQYKVRAWCRTPPYNYKFLSPICISNSSNRLESRNATALQLITSLRPCKKSFVCSTRRAFSRLANDSYPSAMHLANPIFDGSNRSFVGAFLSNGWFGGNVSSASESLGRISSGSTARPSSQMSSPSTGHSHAAAIWKS
jgi:hypothetical protein